MCARLDDPRPVGDLSPMAYEKCMKTLIPNVKSIELTGHGEPFFNEKFMDMFKHAKQSGSFVATTANATLINRTIAEQLVSWGMDRIIISIDAATKDLYEKIRRGARFETVLENIDDINFFKKSTEKKSLNYGFKWSQ